MEDLIHLHWEDLKATAPGFPPEAFVFVQGGLRHTMEHIQRNDDDAAPEGRHVTGRELCIGLRDHALKQYGPLARTVLAHWNVRNTEDFGRIVFAMVTAGLLRKTDEDSLTDFQGVFDFTEAFEELEVG